MPSLIAGDVVEMRAAIAKEKGDGERWDLKYAAGGLIDIEFIAQYLQLVHAAPTARHSRYLDRARARQGLGTCGVLPVEDAEVLRPAMQLYQDLTQILRLCLAGPVRCEDRGGGAVAAVGARRRRAGFRHARCDRDRDAGQGARELRADFGGGALSRLVLRQRALRLERQAHHDEGALAERRADAHAPPCNSHQRFGDGEAEARALMALGQLAFDLLERAAELGRARPWRCRCRCRRWRARCSRRWRGRAR